MLRRKKLKHYGYVAAKLKYKMEEESFSSQFIYISLEVHLSFHILFLLKLNKIKHQNQLHLN